MTIVNNLSVWPEALPPPRVEGYWVFRSIVTGHSGLS